MHRKTDMQKGVKKWRQRKGRISKQGRGLVLTYQQEGSDVGDLVELHEKSQRLLVVAAILAVHRETLPLQKWRETLIRVARQGLDAIFYGASTAACSWPDINSNATSAFPLLLWQCHCTNHQTRCFGLLDFMAYF